MIETIKYNGKELVVRGGAWLDIMNSCFYSVIDKIKGYDICQENKRDKPSCLFYLRLGSITALPCVSI